MTDIFQNRPNIQAFLDFNEATVFGPEYTEHMTATSHLEAIEQMLDASGLPETIDVQAWLLMQTEFWTIAAYKKDTVSPGQAANWTEGLVENLREWFGDEYGDEDGDDGLSDSDIALMNITMRAMVDVYISRTKVWRCEPLRTFTFDNADVLEMVRQLRPDWLNKTHTPTV